MKRSAIQTRISWVLLTMAILVVVPNIALAQNDISFGSLYNCPASSLYNFKVIECQTNRYCKVLMVNINNPSASFETEILRARITDAFKVGSCTINGKALAPEQLPITQQNGEPQQNLPNRPMVTSLPDGQTTRFKTGDRVRACPMQMEDCSQDWENCSVVKDYMATERADSYQVRCDDPQGGPGKLFNVPGKFVQVGAPAEAAPPDCSFNVPGGNASKTAAPSAALFKRVIYERYRNMNPGRQVGVSFNGFSLASTTKNRVVTGHLLQQGAAQGATLYRYKVDTFLLCLRNADETVDRTESQEQYFQCFKSKSGEWECTENGRRSWDHRIVRAR